MMNRESNNFGLIIQGPIVSFGQGPNIVKNGFDSTDTILHNLKVFCPLFSWVVISTWEDEEFKKPDCYINLTLLKSLPIYGDPDNRKKQFFSTSVAVSYLLLNHDINYVVKIRTDQQFDETFYHTIKHQLLNNKENKLIFSEFIANEYFYVGDFIFAGNISKIDFFLKSVLSFDSNLHPSIGVDYVLKYLKIKHTKLFNQVFNKYIPLLIQIRFYPKNELCQFWFWILENEFLFISKDLSKTILWRGKRYSNLGVQHYLYVEHLEEFLRYRKIEKNNLISSIVRIFLEYKKYYSKRLKFHFKIINK